VSGQIPSKQAPEIYPDTRLCGPHGRPVHCRKANFLSLLESNAESPAILVTCSLKMWT